MSKPACLTFAAPEGVDLKGDLYLPDGEGPHPVLVGAPGGAWLRGDRSNFRMWGEYLARNGVALFAVDYRRATAGAIFPKNVQDIVAALGYVGARAGELGLDAGRIGLLGASAGAHLCALAALAGSEPRFAAGLPAGASPPPVKLLVGIYGVYDLVVHWQADRNKNPRAPDPTERMLGAAPYDDQQLYFDASPIRQVAYGRNGLKAMIVWGDSDDDVLPRQSKDFVDALRQAGCFVRTLVVPGAGHFWFGEEPIEEPGSFTGVVAPRLLRFLRQHL